MAEKKDLNTARRLMKSPNKKTARRGLKLIKNMKKRQRGV